jgi:hypothetical protein
VYTGTCSPLDTEVVYTFDDLSPAVEEELVILREVHASSSSYVREVPCTAHFTTYFTTHFTTFYYILHYIFYYTQLLILREVPCTAYFTTYFTTHFTTYFTTHFSEVPYTAYFTKRDLIT